MRRNGRKYDGVIVVGYEGGSANFLLACKAKGGGGIWW